MEVPSLGTLIHSYHEQHAATNQHVFKVIIPTNGKGNRNTKND